MNILTSDAPGLKEGFVEFVRSLFGREGQILLHAPEFSEREKEYVLDTIESTVVSSVGKFVDRFEAATAAYTGAKHAVATANGTAALHMALMLAGVKPGDEVITQAVTFVATANAIAYCGAHPIFVDIEEETLSMSPEKLREFLERNAARRSGECVNKSTGRVMRACVPMHTLGHPARVAELLDVCESFGLTLVEDAAESLGSRREGRHTGLSGRVSCLSFNGNKTITTGGGGMILTNDSDLAKRAKHLTTTAKRPHPWEFEHDEVGYNYRMPNINAALGCAQLERLDEILARKRALAQSYEDYFGSMGVRFMKEPPGCQSNYWLNAIILGSREERDEFLNYTNGKGVATRPLWQLMSRLPMFRDCQTGDLTASEWMEARLVTIPSGVRKDMAL